METLDTNLFLGHPNLVVFGLLFAVCIVVGTLCNTVVSRIVGLPTWAPNTVLYVHLLVGAFSFFFLGPFSLSPDGHTYDAQAVSVAARFGMETPFGFNFPLHGGKEGFPILLGAIYTVLGREPFAAVAINSFVTSITAMVIMAAARLAFCRLNPVPVVVYLATMPTFVTLGPAVMREALCWLGIALACYFAITVLRRRQLLIGLSAGAAGFLILYSVRTGLAALVLVAVVVGLITAFIWTRFGSRAVLVLAGIGAVFVLLFGELLLGMAGYSTNYIISNREFNATTATTGYSVWTGPLDVFGVSGYMISALPKILLGPLPWELGPQLVWGWVLLSTLYWWAALVILVRTALTRPLTQQFVAIIVMAAVLLVALAAFFSNYGVLARMRSLPLVLVLVVLGGVIQKRSLGKVEGYS